MLLIKFYNMASHKQSGRRVHYLGKDGKVYQAPIYLCEEGKFHSLPVTNTAPLDAAKVCKAGFPITTRANVQKFFNSQSKCLNNMDKSNFAVQSNETANGGRGVFRNEMPSISPNKKQLQFKLSNTGTGSHETVIGDHHGFIGDKLNLGQLSYEVIVDGTWNNLSLASIKQVTGANPYDLHGIHITSQALTLSSAPVGPSTPGVISARTNDGSFFEGGGFVRVARAGFVNDSLFDDEIPFAQDIDGGTFRDNVRKKRDWRLILDGFGGLHVKIPALTEITINTYVNSVATNYGMVLVGEKSFWG